MDGDSDIDHFTIPAAAIINVIDLAVEGSITEEELVAWALFFKCREDITYEDGDQKDLSEIVWLLANPEINYVLTPEYLKTLAQRCLTVIKKSNKSEMATPRKPSDQIRASHRRAIPITFCKEMKTSLLSIIALSLSIAACVIALVRDPNSAANTEMNRPISKSNDLQTEEINAIVQRAIAEREERLIQDLAPKIIVMTKELGIYEDLKPKAEPSSIENCLPLSSS